MPRKRPSEINAAEQPIGGSGKITIPTDGSARLEDDGAIEIVDGPAAMNHADEMAFMEETVICIVHPTTDRNAENPVQVSVNGVNQFFLRGQRQPVKRKFIERLARAREDGFSQNLEARDPQEFNRIVRTSGLKYPFSVEGDTPRGQDWLRGILGAAA